MPNIDATIMPPEVKEASEITPPPKSQPLVSDLETKKKTPRKRKIFFVGLFGVVIILGLYLFFSKPVKDIVTNIFPSSLAPDNSISGSLFSDLLEVASKKQSNYTLTNNFMIYVPDSWSARVRSNTVDYFAASFSIPPIVEDSKSQHVSIEVESGLKDKIITNPLITYHDKKNSNMNGLSATIESGVFKLGDVTETVRTVTYLASDNNVFKITIVGDYSDDDIKSFVSSVSYAGQKTSLNSLTTPKAFASDTVGGVDQALFEEIFANASIIDNRLFNDTLPTYKQSSASFYKFQAFRGQQLEIMAHLQEGVPDGIRMDLYDDQQRLLNRNTGGHPEWINGEDVDNTDQFSSYKNMRVTTPKTGTYYLAIYADCSINCEFSVEDSTLDAYKLLIADTWQLQTDTGAVYVAFDYYFPESSTITVGESIKAAVLTFPKPVFLDVDGSITYVAPPSEPFETEEVLDIELALFVIQESYDDFVQNAGNFAFPEENEKNRLDIDVTQINSSTMYITLKNGQDLPSNSHLVLVQLDKQTQKIIYRSRLFTEYTAYSKPLISSDLPPVADYSYVLALCRNSDPQFSPGSTKDYEEILDITNDYWQEVSYGQFSMEGSVVAPGDESGWYTPRGNEYGNEDCLYQADEIINFPDHDGFFLVMNQTERSGGGHYDPEHTHFFNDIEKAYRQVLYTSHQSNPYKDTLALSIHEMGHSIGLSHSGSYGIQYASDWDLMARSAALTYCNQRQFQYGCLPVHPISHHKDELGWIPESRQYIAKSGVNETIFIERLANPPLEEGTYLMAKIDIPNSNDYYTVESRLPVGYDSLITEYAHAAVIIHKIEEIEISGNVRKFAQLVDGDLNGDVRDEGVMWGPGEVFQDIENNITVKVEDGTDTGYFVTISR